MFIISLVSHVTYCLLRFFFTSIFVNMLVFANFIHISRDFLSSKKFSHALIEFSVELHENKRAATSSSAINHVNIITSRSRSQRQNVWMYILLPIKCTSTMWHDCNDATHFKQPRVRLLCYTSIRTIATVLDKCNRKTWKFSSEIASQRMVIECMQYIHWVCTTFCVRSSNG